MSRTLKEQKIVQKNSFTSLTFEMLQELNLANLDNLNNPESYYKSLKYDGVMFELNQFGGYIHLSQILSFYSKTDKFHFIQKYSLDLSDNDFKESGCFAI